MESEKSTLKKKMINATRWSAVTEIVAKLISPITNMILARLLTPEIFGIVATVTMVFSFADIFTDAGFQKYIIQNKFKNESELFNHANVAFWANFFVSICFWAIISIFSESLAILVGSPGLGSLFIVAGSSLPLTSFSSIQVAIYRRNLDFKTLFQVRFAGVILPLFVTAPIAYITHSYWALIIGTICGNLLNTLILTVKSAWKPRPFFRVSILREMVSFSMWSLIEAVSIWLTNYIGVFIVGTILSSYYLGIYKVSMATVNQFISIVTSATTPVLFSTLSRLQNDKKEFKDIFLKFQRMTSYLVVPLGIGLFLYRDFITDVLLGPQWIEAKGFVGLWALISSIKILYSNYCYEVYRALGRPKLAVLAQCFQLVILVPGIYLSALAGFKALYITRSLITLGIIFTNQIIMKVACDFSIFQMLKNTYHAFLASGIMAIAALFLQNVSNSIVWNLVSIVICMIVYIVMLYGLFPKIRSEIIIFTKDICGVISRKVKGNKYSNEQRYTR